VFLANGEAKYFCGRGWTRFQLICPSGKLARMRGDGGMGREPINPW
jgi:hypothetical protein